MASARMYGVRGIDTAVVRRIIEDAGFRVRFRDLAGDAARTAERLREGVIAALGSPAIEAGDVLRPVFFRNKGAYIVGRARRGRAGLPPPLPPGPHARRPGRHAPPGPEGRGRLRLRVSRRCL